MRPSAPFCGLAIGLRQGWSFPGQLQAGGRAAARLRKTWHLLQAGFPLTVIQVEERARSLGALGQGHAGQLLDLQTWVAGAVERSLDLAAGGK